MNPAHSGDASRPPARRRTLRIVERRVVPKAAKLSLWIAFGVALTVFVVYRLWQSDEVSQVRQRTIFEVTLDWKCEGGHSFQLQGQVDPTICAKCGRPAHPVAMYYCVEHGPVEVAARFTATPDGSFALSEVCLPGKEWSKAESGLRCPKCTRELIRAPKDPLAGSKPAER